MGKKMDYSFYTKEQEAREKAVADKQTKSKSDSGQTARYRCEQSVVMKLNGIIHSHADTKREFMVHKSPKNAEFTIKVEMVDNIVEAYQQQLELAIKLVCEIDKIKSDILVSVDDSGKMDKILNHTEIVEKWKKKKEEFENDFAFMRNENSKKEFEKFLEMNNEQISTPENIKNDLNTKLFFDLFFDKYLVGNENFGDYIRTYHSQLFDGYGVGLDFSQDILAESPKEVKVRKVSTLDKTKLDIAFLEKQYDTKFKPMVKYKFSEYNFSVRETSTINTEDHWIEESNVTMIEEVKNNVQVLIDYKLRKIET
ncbi:hypothetical protein [Sinomicrobium weinanense]|uniref:Uncharacterized protein n=1 Tax=Sinomicrobium weinanense TaxID=2842200 RepID=A0A926JPR4_9FLAO|nr:hypothetical protein [Sinomicrobium weinanense]MBC9795074.1 hypothetical protein [Sinomicrobium weinanense]MBU3123797.1 hypothetical protein [Sinomicrobium weinanense]